MLIFIKTPAINPSKHFFYMSRHHHYYSDLQWRGNRGSGTSGYRSYDRDHRIVVAGKAEILGSSDPAFRGDKTKHTPEELLLSSLSACHMLWYLHLCADAGIIVTDYTDHASGTMVETENGGGHFTEVTLHPVVTVSLGSMIEGANALHKKANELCFIASSVNFPIHHVPTCMAVHE